MPLILGLMPILSKAWYAGRDITAPSLHPPLGSGPYKVGDVSPGRSISYTRNRDYWAADLPVNRGQNNFDVIRVDFYRDENTAFEAFKAGQFDLWEEKDPARWARAYDFGAVREGAVVRAAIAHGRPSGLLGFVFNTRRAPFEDIRVRQALNFLFDFEWVNRSFFYGAYRRTRSLFDNTGLAAAGHGASVQERALLAPYADAVPKEIMDKGYAPPVSDGSGHNRDGLRRALALLYDAGWVLRNGQMTNSQTGAPLQFEIMLVRPEEEKLALNFAKALLRLGIKINVRTVDASQYEERLRKFDFDMVVYDWYASLSPGNEQKYYWGSEAAGTPGARNYPGIKSPAMDAMIARLLAAHTEVEFIPAVRAMDRVLMSGHYVIPLYYLSTDNVAHRAHLDMPDRAPLYGFDITTWWDRRGVALPAPK
jgi:peptide/nickel transport system substrate-binding protein